MAGAFECRALWPMLGKAGPWTWKFGGAPEHPHFCPSPSSELVLGAAWGGGRGVRISVTDR